MSITLNAITGSIPDGGSHTPAAATERTLFIDVSDAGTATRTLLSATIAAIAYTIEQQSGIAISTRRYVNALCSLSSGIPSTSSTIVLNHSGGMASEDGFAVDLDGADPANAIFYSGVFVDTIPPAVTHSTEVDDLLIMFCGSNEGVNDTLAGWTRQSTAQAFGLLTSTAIYTRTANAAETDITVQPTITGDNVYRGYVGIWRIPATVAAGQDISPTGIASTTQFGSPTVSLGAELDISPSGISSTLNFGNPTIEQAALEISPTGISSTVVFGVPTVTVDTAVDQEVEPVGIASGLAFGSATIQIGTEKEIIPAGIASTLNFGNATVEIEAEADIFPSGIASTLVFGTPNVEIEAELDIIPSGIAPTVLFGEPTVVLVSQVDIGPTGIASTLAIGIPTVEIDLVPIIVTEAPSERTFSIEQEDRTYNIELENREYDIGFEERTFNVLAGNDDMKRIPKDPDAQLNYSFRIVDWLEDGDSLASFILTASSGIIIASSSSANDIVTAVVSGGTAQGEETLTCRFTTANGLIDERTIIFEMENR